MVINLSYNWTWRWKRYSISRFTSTEHVLRLMDSITGTLCNFAQFRGNVVLIVNTASACGLTPQYQGLQTLYEKYKDRGFTLIAFPCNQFLSQESGTSEEIRKFVKEKYGVTFPVMAKSDVPCFQLYRCLGEWIWDEWGLWLSKNIPSWFHGIVRPVDLLLYYFNKSLLVEGSSGTLQNSSSDEMAFPSNGIVLPPLPSRLSRILWRNWTNRLLRDCIVGSGLVIFY